MLQVEAGTIVVYGDIACPWATLAVHRLHETRKRLGLDDRLRLDLRAFALEIVNERRTPWRILQAELPVAGALDPSAGWQVWQGDIGTWPLTMLPALEAVQAAKEQGLGASEGLDRALRRAFFGESRSISLRHVILDLAGTVDGLDEEALAEALDDGRARRHVLDQTRAAEAAGVQGSPHLFLPDGTDAFNPGVELHWEGEHGKGFPVVDHDDPKVYEALVQGAAD